MRPRAALIAAAGATALAAIALHWTGVLDRFDLAAYDARLALRGERAPPRDVVVVGVDERTLEARNERWPFPRAVQARLVDRLRQAGVRLIVYDIQITETSGDAEQDFALFEAISRARPVVMAVAHSNPDLVFDSPANQREAGIVVGSALFPVGPDGVIRELEGAPGGVVALSVRAAEVLDKGRLLAPRERAWIDFAGPARTIPRYAFSDVLDGKVPSSRLRDRIVVVGVTALRLQDVFAAAPGGELMAGAELQANAIDTLMRGVPLRSAPGWADALLVGVCGLLVSTLAIGLGLRALLVVPVALLALAGAAQGAFAAGIVIVVAAPVAAFLMGSAATGGILARTEGRQRRALRATFARFVPESIVDAVAARAEAGAGLPGEELDATVVFCDLRGFTAYAQERSPDAVLETLNHYLAEVADAVLGHGGTVVAYLGDGVMSVFGAPLAACDHAYIALAAARELVGERLESLNAWLAERGEETRFRLGVGVHSGPVLSGTVGSQRRMEYAAIGDTTNVAARVQALTKEQGVALLLTGATVERLGARDGLEPLGDAAIRGRERSVELWTLRP